MNGEQKATNSGQTDFVLNTKGAKKQFRGRTALHNAPDVAYTGLFLRLGLNPNAQDEQGNTPLHHAASAEQASALLKGGADVCALNDQNQTALMYQLRLYPHQEKLIAFLAAADYRRLWIGFKKEQEALLNAWLEQHTLGANYLRRIKEARRVDMRYTLYKNRERTR